MPASGIFAAEKLVLADSGIEGHFIFEVTTHFRGEFGEREGAGVGLARSGRLQDDAPIGSHDGFILAAGAGLLGAALESFPLRFRLGELRFHPGAGMMDPCLRVGSPQKDTKAQRTGKFARGGKRRTTVKTRMLQSRPERVSTSPKSLRLLELRLRDETSRETPQLRCP